MTDPMLVKAERTEHELLEAVPDASSTYPAGYAVVDVGVLQRAALLIQQMRVRLQGENSTHHGGVDG